MSFKMFSETLNKRDVTSELSVVKWIKKTLLYSWHNVPLSCCLWSDILVCEILTWVDVDDDIWVQMKGLYAHSSLVPVQKAFVLKALFWKSSRWTFLVMSCFRHTLCVCNYSYTCSKALTAVRRKRGRNYILWYNNIPFVSKKLTL